ncbi:cytochrome c3 family protein [Acidobacteriota bacterium]
MKKFFIVLGCFLFVAANFGFAQGITGSAHDFSGDSWSGGQICIACHTPHNALSATDAPLWNHTETGATFTQYTSPTGTLDATVGQPGGISKLCLSCHDGVTALDSFGGAVGTTMIASVGTGAGDFGTDLSNDHPISFTYDSALAGTDGELHDPATASSGLGGTIADDMLFSGSMECSSCHDVHNAYAFSNLLILDNGGSALCLTCHDK